MLDRARMNYDPSDPDLGVALRRLPAADAPADLWSAIARDLPTRQAASRRHRIAVPLAAAAALLAAVLLWLPSRQVPPVDTSVAGQPAADAGEIERLRERSQRIEHWLAALPAASQQGGRNLMATVETEDLIALVDMQLGAARGSEEALPLWRQRVSLLEDLAVIRSTPYGLTGDRSLAGTASGDVTSL